MLEESNDIWKRQVAELQAKLKNEMKENEKLREELIKARNDLKNSIEDDIVELQARLKESYLKLNEEAQLREDTQKELDYTKHMLLAEGKTRILLEERNSALEQELKVSKGGAERGEDSRAQLEQCKRRLEEEIQARFAIQQAKEKLEGELEDLTKSLFEEANSMVSTEAREKHELLQSKKRLEHELLQAQSKLQLDEQLLQSLKEKFSTLEKSSRRPQSQYAYNRHPSQPSLSPRNRQSMHELNYHRFSSQPNLSVGVSLPRRFSGSEMLQRRSQSWTQLSDEVKEGEAPETQPGTGNQPEVHLNGAEVKEKKEGEEETESGEEQGGEQQQKQDGELDGEGEEWEMMADDKEDNETSPFVHIEARGLVDQQVGLAQFVSYVTSAKQDWTGSRLMDRILRDDVAPCLRLRMQEDKAYRKLLEAVWNNRIFIEPYLTSNNQVCTACEVERGCKWRLRLGPDTDWKMVGDLCRERIVRACDFYSYLRNIRKGLVKKTLVGMYKEYCRLRLLMHFARICAG